jgi:hypothetical protein
MARGTHEPTTKYNNEIEPLARIQRDGTLAFFEEFSKELLEANGHAYLYVQQTNGATDRNNWIEWVKPESTKQ